LKRGEKWNRKRRGSSHQTPETLCGEKGEILKFESFPHPCRRQAGERSGEDRASACESGEVDYGLAAKRREKKGSAPVFDSPQESENRLQLSEFGTSTTQGEQVKWVRVGKKGWIQHGGSSIVEKWGGRKEYQERKFCQYGETREVAFIVRI